MLTLRYLFWPNPGFASYTDPDMIALLAVCVLLIVGSFIIGFWRRKQSNPIARKLSKSWSSVAFWFGIVGLVMVVSRVEDIQFFAMRFLWIVWLVLLLLYVWFQIKRWRARHYEVLPTVVTHDPRDAYLPKRKKR
jgi:hypothetical protein